MFMQSCKMENVEFDIYRDTLTIMRADVFSFSKKISNYPITGINRVFAVRRDVALRNKEKP